MYKEGAGGPAGSCASALKPASAKAESRSRRFMRSSILRTLSGNNHAKFHSGHGFYAGRGGAAWLAAARLLIGPIAPITDRRAGSQPAPPRSQDGIVIS